MSEHVKGSFGTPHFWNGVPDGEIYDDVPELALCVISAGMRDVGMFDFRQRNPWNSPSGVGMRSILKNNMPKRQFGSGAIDQRGEKSWRIRFRVRGKRIAKTIHVETYDEAVNVASLVIEAVEILNNELEIALLQNQINDLGSRIHARYYNPTAKNARNVGQV